MFSRYIGIDYSGARTPTSSLKGLRAYMALPGSVATEVLPPPSVRKYWTRKGIAEWLISELQDSVATFVGIDHAFSFPLSYFTTCGVSLEWPSFLDDFHSHWPTDGDGIRVDFVRRGFCGASHLRRGDSRWRRTTEIRAKSAKSVFHFDVQGSVAKSTHAGLPWLRYARRELGNKVFFWPFDGWCPPQNNSVIAEVYPALWNKSFPQENRTSDQHDAFVIAEWTRRLDEDQLLKPLFRLPESDNDRSIAKVEGWILGVR